MADGADIAGVAVRPPLLFAGSLAVAAALNWLWPIASPLPGGAVRIVAAALLAGFGLAIAGMAIFRFGRAGTPVPTWQPTTALVDRGVYAYSRNPIYVGMIALYAGIAVALANPWAFVLLAPVLAVLRWGVIAREERYLERRFADAYRDYCARVRRWL